MKRYSAKILRVSVIMLISAVLIFSVTACTGDGGFKMKDLADSDKTFSYPELKWGCSPDWAMDALGYDIVSDGTPAPDENGNVYITMYGDSVTLEGAVGKPLFQFVNDYMWATGIDFECADGKNGEDEYNKIISAGLDAFGKPQEQLEQKNDEIFEGMTLANTMWERADENGVTTRVLVIGVKRDDKLERFSVNISQFPISEEYLKHE